MPGFAEANVRQAGWGTHLDGRPRGGHVTCPMTSSSCPAPNPACLPPVGEVTQTEVRVQ